MGQRTDGASAPSIPNNIPSNIQGRIQGRISGRILVIGAGIVGAACAHRLRTLGFEVVLIDRDAPGHACSFGNAGRIATSLVTPKSVPGLLRKVPGMLLDRRHPLKTSAGFVLRNLAWCRRFARAGTLAEVARITDALHVLLSRADAAIDRLAASVGATDLIRTEGVLYVYQDPALAEADRDAMAESDRRGTPTRYVTGDQVRDIEPALPASVTSGFHKPEERFVRSPLEFTTRVVEAFTAAGGVLVRDEVVGFEERVGRPPRVRCRGGSHEADKVVVAAGAWSPRLAAPLGVRLLVVPERGYHAMLPCAGVGLKTAVHYGDRLISMTPMTGGLRLSSGAELADADAAPDWARRDVVVEGSKALFPKLDDTGATRWMGPRPSTPDTVPVIGAHPAHPDVLFATGHGQLGLTLSAVTAEIVGDLAVGRVPNFDLSPYRPERF
ncbi:MAG: FAD-dependent oxidoreductase [Thiotrichales bacterium]|nr:FAD-dependent oxidoreductase [Thiotrichales bacterium]